MVKLFAIQQNRSHAKLQSRHIKIRLKKYLTTYLQTCCFFYKKKKNTLGKSTFYKS